jgi:ATP-binding cassette subfamily B protein
MPGARPTLRSLWRLRAYLRTYRWQYLWCILAGLCATGVSIAIPLLAARIVDGPVLHHDLVGLWELGGLAMAFGVIEAALIFYRRWTQSASAASMETELRNEIYAHLQRLPIEFHDGWQSGQLLSRVTTDLSVLRRFVAFSLIFLVISTATFVAVVVVLIQLYWPLGLLVSVSVVPLGLITHRFTRDYNSASRRVQDQLGDLASLAEESAAGIRVIRAFGRRDHMGGRFDQQAQLVYTSSVVKTRMLAAAWPKFDAVPNVIMAFVLLGGAAAVATGRMTTGELVAFVALQLMLVWPIDSLGYILANGQEAMTAADRVYEVLDTQPSIMDSPHATVLEPATVRGEIRFEDVWFTYPGTPRPVLRGINLEVRPGETLAIVGATGSGKSTLVSLVPRIIDVGSGRVRLDGRDIRDSTVDSLRSVIGVAFEEAGLFSMSVRENLTLGRPDATDDDIREALAIAQADFVYELPWKLDTRIGEQGLSLSGGQRQRLALARAVLGKPRVLVLDDPLSALDVHTEELVEEALRRILVGTTALLVVHRPSTVALADRVALLQDGVIAAVGTHSELLARVPAYRDLLSAAADDIEADDIEQGVGVS